MNEIGENVKVIGCINHISKVDSAVVRRMEASVLVDVPIESERLLICKDLLLSEQHVIN